MVRLGCMVSMGQLHESVSEKSMPTPPPAVSSAMHNQYCPAVPRRMRRQPS